VALQVGIGKGGVLPGEEVVYWQLFLVIGVAQGIQ